MAHRWFVLCERVAPWFAGFLMALPILLVRYPPMPDLAMHEALVAILRHRGDATWAPQGLYFVVAPQANQLFSMLALALSFLAPTDLACKVVVSAVVFAAIPAAARHLARMGASPWLSLLVGPVVCGWMFRWGLAPNMTGFTVLLLALPSLERLAVRPTWRSLAVGIALTVLVFFGHESSAVLLAIIAGLFAFVRGRSLAGIATRIVPSFVVLLLVVLQSWVSRRLVGEHMGAIGSYFGAPVLERVRLLPGAVFGGMGGGRLAIVGGVSCTALIASVLGTKRAGAPLRVALWRHRYALLAGTFFALYLTFPMALHGATLLAHRFLPGACICLVFACAARTRRGTVALFAFAAPLSMLLAEADSFAGAERTYTDLDRIIAFVPRNVAVAQLDLTPRARGHVAPVPGAASRVQAERGGRMLFALTDTPPNPVYLPRTLQWNEPVGRLASSPYAFLPAFDLQRFSYLVARNDNAALRPVIARALQPEAQLVASEGEWDLFRSRVQVDPLTAPDAVPAFTEDSLGARVTHLLGEEHL